LLLVAWHKPKGYEAPLAGSLFLFDNGIKGNTLLFMIAFSMILSMIQPSLVTEDFLDRVAIIESNYNHLAVGDNGSARGAYQMHEAAWTDAMSSLKQDWPWRQDAFHAEKSRAACRAYFLIIEKRMVKDGYVPTKERLYMCYNIGYHDAVYWYKLNPKHNRIPAIRQAILRRAKFYLQR
jgi:hypothetical protein